MLQRNLILVYEGEFTQDITKSVLMMTERNMDSAGEKSNTKRKVFNVMVECLQNIGKHADKPRNDDLNHAIFMIGKKGDDQAKYLITSGNTILKSKVPALSRHLENINNRDEKELKVLYKKVIKSGTLSEKGGAGLGFIDMARKSGNKLQFHFEEVDDEYSFFVLTTVIIQK